MPLWLIYSCVVLLLLTESISHANVYNDVSKLARIQSNFANESYREMFESTLLGMSPNTSSPIRKLLDINNSIFANQKSIAMTSHDVRKLNEAVNNMGRYPDTFWINMDSNTARRRYMEHQLNQLGIPNRRIPAVTPNSSLYVLNMLEKPCKRNTPREIAVIISHLVAIFNAIYLPITPTDESTTTSKHDSSILSEYALIMEDDVRFEFQINFEEMLSKHVPSDLGILQLMTSNREAIIKLWNRFNASDISKSTSLWKLSNWKETSKGGKNALYWSCQAYLIKKSILKLFIDDVIDFNKTTLKINGFKIVNSFNQKNCERTNTRPCILAYCLFSDTYIYSGGGPTYVSRIPMFNGDLIGYKSEIHQDQVYIHRLAFEMIDNIIKYLKKVGNKLVDDEKSQEVVFWEGDKSYLRWNKHQYLPNFLHLLFRDSNDTIIGSSRA